MNDDLILKEVFCAQRQKGAETLQLAAGSFLYRQGEAANTLYFLLSGELSILEETAVNTFAIIDHVEPNEPVGEAELILSSPRQRAARAETACELLVMSFAAFEQQATVRPALMQEIGRFARRRSQQSQLFQALRTLFGDLAKAVFARIEPELQWIPLSDGDWLEEAVGLHILVAGRLQAVAHGSIRNEVGPGEPIGAVSLISGNRDETRYQAMHDSTLVRLSSELFQQVSDSYPVAYQTISKIAVNRLLDVIDERFDANALVTIAVVPLAQSDYVDHFCAKLATVLAQDGATQHLTSSRVNAVSERAEWSQTEADDPWSIQLTAWLDQQEAAHRFVVYQTDATVTPWTRRAILRAEYILLVGDAGSDQTITEIERQLLTAKTLETVRRHALVLLHPNGDHHPKNTQTWLDARNMEDVYHVRLTHEDDFARIGRFLAGRSVGLVFGGGGGRGLAHIGIVNGLTELGIPIDYVGGTSVGSMIAATCALGYSGEGMRQMGHDKFIDRNPFKSYTLPLMSILNPQAMDDLYQDIWGDYDIADLWIPYFSIAANITSAEMVVQRTGRVWESVRASQALPGVVVPHIRNRELLIDGGVVDNVPVATMQQLNRGPIIASDVSPKIDLRSDYSYDDLPSPWQIMRSRLNPFRKSVSTFSIGSVMVRSMVINTISRKEEAKKIADVWFDPDCSVVNMMDITHESLETLFAIGYNHVMENRDRLSVLDG
ncbi:MAG: patatin-like phospholipase family protein [Chloroflexota bacterium]